MVEAEEDVASGVHVVQQSEVLEDDAGARYAGPFADPQGVVTEYPDVSAGRDPGPRVQQPGQQRQGQGLAGPAGAHEEDQLSFLDPRRRLVEQDLVTCAEDQPLDRDRRVASVCRHRSSPMTPVSTA